MLHKGPGEESLFLTLKDRAKIRTLSDGGWGA